MALWHRIAAMVTPKAEEQINNAVGEVQRSEEANCAMKSWRSNKEFTTQY